MLTDVPHVSRERPDMPRTARASLGGLCFHVVDRGNARATVFRDGDDYAHFLELAAEATGRVGMRVVAYCLMPNHIHFVLWPRADGDLGRWAHWLLTTHVSHHHKRHGSSGRVWQGRFKAFPVATDRHLLTVLRYVERNPLRAGLVSRAADWPWGSLPSRHGRFENPRLETESPIALPRTWPRIVEQPLTESELRAIRRCSGRQRPYGDESWAAATAVRMGLDPVERRPGRPRTRRDAG